MGKSSRLLKSEPTIMSATMAILDAQRPVSNHAVHNLFSRINEPDVLDLVGLLNLGTVATTQGALI
jgi:hypothetical protein